MTNLLAALDAFRRCGELDDGGDGDWVWMACECGANIVRPVQPARPSSSGLAT